MVLNKGYICGEQNRINMKDIAQVYHNDFGVAFYWKKNEEVVTKRVQLVFRQTGFYLTPAQLVEFSGKIAECEGSNCCNCSLKGRCHRFLLKTPVPEVDLAINYDEYLEIKDLVEGTLFKINLLEYLGGAGLN